MKRKYIFTAALMGSALAMTSCSDEFLQEKGNYGQSSVIAYDTYAGSNARLNDVYSLCLPDEDSDPSWKSPNTGRNDSWLGKSTEEYSGFSSFTDPRTIVNTDGTGGTRVIDFFHNKQGDARENPWGRLRNLNDVIRGVTNGAMSQEDKNKILGQLHFLRGWCYYNFVRWYGGVPIITEVQDPVEGVWTPRSSTKDCIQFICDEFDLAAELLMPFTSNGGWTASGDYGRPTAGSALAMKGRVLLMWASPLFNRSDDATRWTEAYNFMKEALPKIEACGHGLYGEGNPGINATSWAKMFVDIDRNPEALFIKLNNTIAPDGRPDYSMNSNWEHEIRPGNAMGGGGKEASAMLVDMFPMADGKRPASTLTYTKLEASEMEYNENMPFVGRDPRFYRTFAFPGVRWAFNGDPRGENDNPYNGNAYELWNYVWYLELGDAGNAESGDSYAADGLLGSKRGIYVRKRSDDLDVNASPLYVFTGSFKQSGVPYFEYRFAEFLLNYAEAACGADQMSVAVEQLKRIRARVGYTADNNYGLQSNLSSDKAACMSAILYERQIELAYEGKRFDDLRRWMLFDGGTGTVSGAPSSWNLTGWSGNTCTWLGFKQLNGQRRDNMQFRTADKYGVGGNDVNGDPLLKEESGAEPRPKAIDYRKELEPQIESLKVFYQNNLVRKRNRGDEDDSDGNLLTINFRPEYYFIGLNNAAQTNNKNLPQNIGWDDYNKPGSKGTFDPLAETVAVE